MCDVLKYLSSILCIFYLSKLTDTLCVLFSWSGWLYDGDPGLWFHTTPLRWNPETQQTHNIVSRLL